MRVYSIRFSRKLRVSLALVLALALVVTVGRTVTAMLPVSASPRTGIGKPAGKTEEQRQDFLTKLGWTAEEIPGETAEVLIPKEWDEIYEKYNALQKEQGADLSRYKGKKCTRYTYLLINHPTSQQNVRINLLVCKGKIVGGDICSLGLDGFMHTLFYPQTTPQPLRKPNATERLTGSVAPTDAVPKTA